MQAVFLTDLAGNGAPDEVTGSWEHFKALKSDDLDAVAKLQKTSRYQDIIKRVEEANQTRIQRVGLGEYQLIVECNTLSVEIDKEIRLIYKFIRERYRLKFPELELLILRPIDYVRVVKRLGNKTDVTIVDFEDLLPSATKMFVSVTASTSSGKPLSEENLQKTLDACDRALELHESKKKVLDFVGTRMACIAPNLSTILGSAVAAKLMGTAGGMSMLARMPASTLQLLGAKKKTLAGFSKTTALPHTAFIFHAEIIRSTPPALRMRVCRLVSAKASLAARVDAMRGDPTGQTGRDLMADIRKKIENHKQFHQRRLQLFASMERMAIE